MQTSESPEKERVEAILADACRGKTRDGTSERLRRRLRRFSAPAFPSLKAASAAAPAAADDTDEHALDDDLDLELDISLPELSESSRHSAYLEVMGEPGVFAERLELEALAATLGGLRMASDGY